MLSFVPCDLRFIVLSTLLDGNVEAQWRRGNSLWVWLHAFWPIDFWDPIQMPWSYIRSLGSKGASTESINSEWIWPIIDKIMKNSVISIHCPIVCFQQGVRWHQQKCTSLESSLGHFSMNEWGWNGNVKEASNACIHEGFVYLALLECKWALAINDEWLSGYDCSNVWADCLRALVIKFPLTMHHWLIAPSP